MNIIAGILKRMVTVLLYVVAVTVAIALLLCTAVWVMTPVYEFKEPVRFSGNGWYNPYRGLDSSTWYKANFHAHSNSWGGLTNGNRNSSEDVFKAYRELGYEFATLSNYQKVTEKAFCGFPYIPAQEYGINILKTHLLLIGSSAPVYIDQPLIQGKHTKQYRINRIRGENEIIVLAHPGWNEGFKKEDMEILGGYDLIEVLNHFHNSIEYWDAALSAGKPAFLLASDDAHNVFSNSDVVDRVTMVPHSAEYSRFIYNTLKEGSSYGISVAHKYQKCSFSEKKELIDGYPRPLSISMSGDTLSVILDKEVAKLRLIGDGGMEMASSENCRTISLAIPEEFTYARCEALLEDGSFILFNPVIRSTDGSRPEMPQVEKSRWKTNLKSISIITILVIGYIMLRIRIIRKRRRR